jgi:hypothetical protein
MGYAIESSVHLEGFILEENLRPQCFTGNFIIWSTISLDFSHLKRRKIYSISWLQYMVSCLHFFWAIVRQNIKKVWMSKKAHLGEAINQHQKVRDRGQDKSMQCMPSVTYLLQPDLTSYFSPPPIMPSD